MTKKLRIGAVPYMNAKPLIYGLDQHQDEIELVFEVPSLLPGMLNNDQIDVAIIPSIEYFRNGNYAIIPDISIASIGTVESVKIFSKIPIQNIRSAALDKSSLTSCALTRIILKEQYHLSPQYSQWNKQYDIEGTDTDAVLIIGDNALKIIDNGYITLDLGQSKGSSYTGNKQFAKKCKGSRYSGNKDISNNRIATASTNTREMPELPYKLNSIRFWQR